MGGTHLHVAMLLRKLAQVDLLRSPDKAALIRCVPPPPPPPALPPSGALFLRDPSDQHNIMNPREGGRVKLLHTAMGNIFFVLFTSLQEEYLTDSRLARESTHTLPFTPFLLLPFLKRGP